MKIALIIPVYNEEETLPRLLSAVVSMRFEEIIVVDGGSQDRTVEAVRPFQAQGPPDWVQLVTSERGRAVQMNAGAARSTAEILVFLHADTELPPDARQLVLEAMSDSSCVGGRFDVRFPNDHGWAWVISRMMNLRSRWTGICTGDQAIFVRRCLFEHLGGFSEIPLMEDIEFTARLKKIGPVVALRETVTTSFRRWERDGPLRTILRMWTLRLLYWLGWDPKTLQKFYDAIR